MTWWKSKWFLKSSFRIFNFKDNLTNSRWHTVIQNWREELVWKWHYLQIWFETEMKETITVLFKKLDKQENSRKASYLLKELTFRRTCIFLYSFSFLKSTLPQLYRGYVFFFIFLLHACIRSFASDLIISTWWP